MKRIFLLLTTALFFTFFIQSCKNEISPEDAKNSINEADQDLSSMVNSIKDGKAVTAFEDFINYSKSKIAKEKNSEEWIDTMFNQLDDLINFEQISNNIDNEGRFYFDNYKGKYTWNNSTSTWNKTTSNNIIIEFPSEESSNLNDVVFTFSSYTDTQATFDGRTIYPPTSLHADLKLNNEKLFGVDLYEAVYTNSISVLRKLNLVVYVNPITTTYIYDNKSSTNYYASANITDNTNTIGVSVDLNTLREITEDFDENDLKDVSGEVFFNNLKFKYDADLQSIVAYGDEPTEAQINEDINVEVYVGDKKAGYLFIENDNIYIVYNDDSRELFEDAFSNLINEIENFTNQYAKNNKSKVKMQRRKILKYVIFKTSGYKNLKRFVKYEHNILSKK